VRINEVNERAKIDEFRHALRKFDTSLV